MTESQQRVEQAALFLLRPPNPHPTYSAIMQRCGLLHPGDYLKLCPLLHNRHAETKMYNPHERTIKAPEKIQLSDEEIANLSDAGLKTLVMRMPTEMV